MADELEKEIGVRPELRMSSGGVFEVEVDGELIFSKKELGRFPAAGEVVSLIRQHAKPR